MRKKIYYRGRARNDIVTDLEGPGITSKWRFENDIINALYHREWLEEVPSWAITCEEILRAWRGGSDYKLVKIAYGTTIALAVVENSSESVIIHSIMGISIQD